MTQLLALSFDGPTSPRIRLRAVEAGARSLDAAYGWGLAWYPSEGAAAMVVKDPTSVGTNALTDVLTAWERFSATVFLGHLRGAAKRTTHQDTQPFRRTWGGRDWVFGHNGDLRTGYREALSLGDDPVFEPVGASDSEYLLCWLLERMRAEAYRRLRDVPAPVLCGWLREANRLGTLNCVLSDGSDLVVYSDGWGYRPLYWRRHLPPEPMLDVLNDEVELRLGADGASRAAVMVSTQPLSDAVWCRLDPGSMLVARRGAVVDRVEPEDGPWEGIDGAPGMPRIDPSAAGVEGMARLSRALDAAARATPSPDPEPDVVTSPEPTPWTEEDEASPRPTLIDEAARSESTAALHRAARVLGAPEVLRAGLSREVGDDLESVPEAPRILETYHETLYRYDAMVEHSAHRFRLRPLHDATQELLDHALEVEPACPARDYPDVFGNHTVETVIRQPYRVLRIVARSRVLIHGHRRARLRSSVQHHRLPLVWMPWQRQFLSPYLLPPELPESQLRELSTYALGFAARQDHDVVETLKDINQTIHSDYAYVPQSTSLATTPWQVFTSRRGVCQDFANLFICLARLLDIPARYRVGYIYTGRMYADARQGDASHAWVEVYLPRIGWRGFDPTNGTLVIDDHVRVACGRHYADATPTEGTLYKGGGGLERLAVDVKVVDLTDRADDRAATRWVVEGR